MAWIDANETINYEVKIMGLSKKAKTRVTKLIEFMESLPPSANKHFDMKKLFAHKGKGHAHHIPIDNIPVEAVMTCGTTACALGWACTMPYFKRLGLTVSRMGDAADSEWGVDQPEIFDLYWAGGEDVDAWDELFGSHNNDKTPKSWAKRARKLLAKWDIANR